MFPSGKLNYDIVSPISKIKIDPNDHTWQTLNYFHWLTLFSNYNISLYNRYVAILPQINLNRIVSQSDILKYRNPNEIQKYDSIITQENDTRLNFNEIKYEHSESNISISISKINDLKLEENTNYKTALFELFGIVVFGIPTIFLVVYVAILFYKCLCSKNYEQWRNSWSTSNIKRQYKMIHSKVKRKTNNQFVEDEKYSDIEEQNDESSKEIMKRNDCFENGEDSEDSNYYYETKSELSNKLNKDDIIHQIINGQKDQLELKPLKTLNHNNQIFAENFTNHNFSVDMIENGNYLCVTADLNNQINVWSLVPQSLQTSFPFLNGDSNLKSLIFSESVKNDLILSINMQAFNRDTSVWSLSLTNDDRFLFIGQSDGQLTSFDLFSKDRSKLFSKNSLETKLFSFNKTGITHLFQINNNGCNNKKFKTGYYLIAARLNGYLELIKFDNFNAKKEEKCMSFKLLHSIRVDESPLTNISYSENGSYIMTTGQDCSLKVIKLSKSLKTSILPTNLDEDENEELNVMFVSHEHGEHRITAMCIDPQNSLNASTGSQNGIIRLWNLFTGECKNTLGNHIISKKTGKINSGDGESSILKLELVQNRLISLSSDEQMCIWDTNNGTLLKEFKFFAPVTSLATNQRNNEYEDSQNNFTDGCLKSFENSAFRKVFNSFTYLLKSLFTKKLNHQSHTFLVRGISIDELVFRPPPSMCLYSKNILITGGLSCIFLWNITKGELFKKINIKTAAINKHRSNLNYRLKYSQLNLVKQIKVIHQKQFDSGLNVFSPSIQTSNNIKNINKLLLIMDYMDLIYIIKIPANIIQNLA
jgi:hypothetical protein